MSEERKPEVEWTYQDYLADAQEQMQQAEREQNQLDGGSSIYEYTIKDAEELSYS